MFFFRSNGFALRAGQRQGGVFRIPPPYLWTPLSPQRVKGCSPLTIPKMRSKPKNASRFAKRIFLCFSHLRLRRRFHVSAELHALRGRNTCCEAANRRNEKKALSEATSFFPFRQLLWGLKGASSPFLVDPARRNRWCFSGSLLARKREQSALMKKRSAPAPPAREAAQKKKSQCSTWNTGPLPSPLCRCRRDAHGILNVPIPLFPVRRCRYAVVRHQADGMVDGIHKNADVLHH